MSLLAVLLLPLVAALWLALARRHERPGALAFVALAPLAAGLFMPDTRVGVAFFLTTPVTVFELDAGSRAPLLLFGSLWLIAGLMYRRSGDGRAVIPLLLALAGAVTVALAKQGPAVLCGLLVAGFALSAVVAIESGTTTRQPVRILAAVLVASYLLVFEALLHDALSPTVSAGAAAMIVLAVALSGAAPPAHVWQTAVLTRASAATSLLLVGVPAGVAMNGGLTLLSGAGAGLAPLCLALAIAGAAWSARAGTARHSAVGTLGFAAAATASLLLAGLPAADAVIVTRWLALSLLACVSALTLLRLARPGLARTAATYVIVLVHGIAAGQLALLAGSALPRYAPAAAAIAAVPALLATMLVTLTARRAAAMPVISAAPGGTRPALLLAALGAAGLAVAWLSGADRLAAAWPAAAGIGLGLLLPRLPRATMPHRSRRAVMRLLAAKRRAHRFFDAGLPRTRDRLQSALVSLWHGEAWSSRIAGLEALLGRWPATALFVLFIAIAVGLLLLG